jgi:hypothetical protein
MRALRHILKTKELYVNEKTIDEKRIKYERTVDPTKAFIVEATYEDVGSHSPKISFYDAYVSYCKEHGLPFDSYDVHCKNLKKNFRFDDSKLTIDGKRVHCWNGILLIPKYSSTDDQTSLD